MLKLQCKTTFNSVFVGKKETIIDFEKMLWKIVVLYEIYSKKSVTEYFWHVSVYHNYILYNVYMYDFGIMFLQNVVLFEIYSKKSQWPNTFGTSLYMYYQWFVLWE
jgi:hypothetical protein